MRSLLRSDGVFQRLAEGPEFWLDDLAPDEFIAAFPDINCWAVYRAFDFTSSSTQASRTGETHGEGAFKGWGPGWKSTSQTNSDGAGVEPVSPSLPNS